MVCIERNAILQNLSEQDICFHSNLKECIDLERKSQDDEFVTAMMMIPPGDIMGSSHCRFKVYRSDKALATNGGNIIHVIIIEATTYRGYNHVPIIAQPVNGSPASQLMTIQGLHIATSQCAAS